MASAAATDWIDHDGGPCPVDPKTIVDVRDRAGIEVCGFEAAVWSIGNDWWAGEASDPGDNIVAYRVVPA
jgi:hypothetical protein